MSLPIYFISSMMLLQLGGHLRDRRARRRPSRRRGPLRTMKLNVPKLRVLVRVVVAEVAAAALAPLDRRARDRLRDGQQVVQVERRVPAGVVLAMAADADAARRARAAGRDLERALHLGLVPHDADEVLHHLLQRVLHLVRALALTCRARTARAPGAPPRRPAASSMLPRSCASSRTSPRIRRRACRTR